MQPPCFKVAQRMLAEVQVISCYLTSVLKNVSERVKCTKCMGVILRCSLTGDGRNVINNNKLKRCVYNLQKGNNSSSIKVQ